MLNNKDEKKIVKLMQLRLCTYLILSFFFSCGVFQNNKNSNELTNLNDLDSLKKNQSTPLIKMKKTPCFGKCPYFEVSIFNDGSIRYEGFKFVDMMGVYTSQINNKKIALIEDYIRRLDFFSLNEVYDARVTDLPSIIIEVNLNGRYHKVKGRYRMPDNFKMFTKFIDNLLLGVDSWISITN